MRGGRKNNTRSDSYSMIGHVGTCAPCRPPKSCLMPIPCYDDPGDNASVIGPAWTRGEIEKPGGLRDMGGWTANYYTTEQQNRLGVDENGNPTGFGEGAGLWRDLGVTPAPGEGVDLEGNKLDIPKSCGVVIGGNCDAFDKWKTANKRCMDVGGDVVENSSAVGSLGEVNPYGSCAGNRGTGGDISLCKDFSGKCDVSPEDPQHDKVRAYYGKTDMYKVDELSQYYKDVTKVVNNAMDMLNKNKDCFCSMLSEGVLPVASFDLDDTVWNTFGAMQLKFNQKAFDDAALQSKFPPIQPVIDLIKNIREMGILPVFITGRASTPAVVNETMKELDAFSKLTGLTRGYHYWYGTDVAGGTEQTPNEPSRDNSEVVQSNGGVFMHSPRDVTLALGHGAPRPSKRPDSGKSGKALPASLYKATTRCWIQKKGLSGMKVHFVMSVGDQWSDSNGRCSGIKVKLPNPMYYLP
jgi:hypothetical protein